MESNIPLLFALTFCMSAVFSLAVTPLVRRWASVCGAIDHPDGRKIHNRPIPRLGGLAVACASALSILTLQAAFPTALQDFWVFQDEGFLLGGCLLMMLALGIWDDIHPLPPRNKMAVQFLAGLLACRAGFSFSSPETSTWVETLTNYGSSILWIVGVTNAFNLVDGLDGLASGIGIIACLGFASLSALNHDPGTAFIAVILGGALFGFLRFNFNPAKIFLGDSGSLTTGFLIAALSFKCMPHSHTRVTDVAPALVIGLPILDTTLSVVRRLARSSGSASFLAPGLAGRFRQVFLPDKNHIHHRLLGRGMSQRKAVTLLYAVSFGMALCALSLALVDPRWEWPIVFAVLTVSFLGIWQLRYAELSFVKDALLRKMRDEVLSRPPVLMALDAIFIVVSFGASRLLISSMDTNVGFTPLLERAGVVLVIQHLAFRVSGLYKDIARYSQLEHAVRILAVVALAVVATGLLLSLISLRDVVAGDAVLTTDALFLFVFLYATRGSQRQPLRPTPFDSQTQSAGPVCHPDENADILTAKGHTSVQQYHARPQGVYPSPSR